MEDEERLAALRNLQILDTPSERAFDDAVTVASHLCDVSVALVSLVDRERQWFKARVGFDPPETDLGRSVCRHALAGPDILEIPDLTRDERTRDNPLVTGEPFLRFYAGVPLRTDEGHALGTLCVMDHAPRPGGLTERQRIGLGALARQVVAQFRLRKALIERDAAMEKQAEAQARALADAARLEALIATQRRVSLADADLDAVFRALVTGALEVVDGADGVMVEMLEGDGLAARAAAGTLAPFQGQVVALGGTLSQRAIREGTPFLLADALLGEGADAALAGRLDIRSLIAVPVIRREALVGVLKIKSFRPGVFSARDLAMAQMLAGLASSAFGDVAEVRSRRELREAEARYRQTFESVTEFAIVVSDPDGVVTDWNTGAERMFGWTAAEMTGRSADAVLTRRDRADERWRADRDRAVRGENVAEERWYVRRDGERLFGSGNLMPLRGDRGEPIGFIQIVRDRTVHHRTTERLRRTQERLQLAMSATGIGTFDYDLRSGALTWDARAKEIFGIPPENEVDYGLFLDALHTADRDWVDAAVRGATSREGTREYDVEYRLREPDAAGDRWIAANGRTFDDAEGPARFVGTVRDVTERRRAEAALRASEHQLSVERALLEAVVQQAPVGISIVHADGSAVVNARLRDMLGHEPSDGARGFAGYSAFHDDGRPMAVDEFPSLRALRAGEALFAEPIRYRNQRTGETRRWEVSSTPVRDDRNRVLAAVSLFVDVEDRRRGEERQTMLNRELSHRLKNTFAIVQAIAAQTLRSASDLDSARDSLGQRIRTLSAAHDILVAGHRDAGAVQAIVRAAVDLHDPGGRIELAGPPVEIGPTAALSLALIMHELATNAAKYGALGSGDGRIRIDWATSAAGGGDVLLELNWVETGGPPALPPSRKGFGTRLVERGLSGAADASVAMDYLPEGLRCRIVAPMRDLAGAPGD